MDDRFISGKSRGGSNAVAVVFCGFFLLLVADYSTAETAVKRPAAEAEYEALKAIKSEFVDFKGLLASWNGSAGDHGDGFGGGACSGKWVGIKCVDGQVVSIQLPWKGLGGRISEQIGKLQALRRLSLHDNLLTGPVPISLGFLSKLRAIYLFNNRLSGSIPPSIGNLTLLRTLDLSNNRLIGVVPPVLANFTRLYRLNLSFNSLSGHIPPSLSRNPSITFLALERNNLSGSVPDSWTSYKLESLTLDRNLLSGTVPLSSLSKLSLLEEINLSHNRIEGLERDELGLGANLKSLDLSNNAITGSFPSGLTNLSSLLTLNLEKNSFDGHIPSSIDGFKNLSVLNLSNNKFSGEIPDSMGNITTITSINLSHNSLTGVIPSSIVNLPNLISLDVSYNNLSGTVQSSKFNSSSFIGNIQLSLCNSSTACKNIHRRLSTKDKILIAAGALLVVLLTLCSVLLCCLIRKKAKAKAKTVGRSSPGSRGGGVGETGSSGGKLVHFEGGFVFTADDLLCATAEIMGKSNYGTSYKATLEDNNQVAVKRLREKMTKADKEFEIEVAQLGQIRHPNILSLRAYYLGPKGEKLLVYDYMPNGSLSSFLHGRGPETSIPWPTRMSIAIGITRGLCSLHADNDLTHGNLTSTVVLLDENHNPRIADVGLSRLIVANSSSNNSAAGNGMTGYCAPEVASSKIKIPSAKSDVFSLGVILLELLTGKTPGEAADGLGFGVEEDGSNGVVFDAELVVSNEDQIQLMDTLKLALRCVDPSPEARPETHQILNELQQIHDHGGGRLVTEESS